MSPAAVDEEFLAGDAGAVFTGEEEGDVGDLFGLEQIGDALDTANHFLHLRRHEFLQLPFRHDPAWRNGIHADSARAEFPGQCAGEGNDATFARYWMHNGYLTIDGEKMSKSLGNFFTIHDVLAHAPGEAMRYP